MHNKVNIFVRRTNRSD